MIESKYRKKRKISVAEDGTLLYPHSFVVGKLIKARKNVFPVKAKKGGYGLIIKVEYPDLYVYWQNSGITSKHYIPVAILEFSIET